MSLTRTLLTKTKQRKLLRQNIDLAPHPSFQTEKKVLPLVKSKYIVPIDIRPMFSKVWEIWSTGDMVPQETIVTPGRAHRM